MTPIKVPTIITTPMHPDFAAKTEEELETGDDNGEDVDIKDNGITELSQNGLLFGHL